MKIALALVTILVTLVCMVSAEKYKDPNAPMFTRQNVDLSSRVDTCIAVVGMPTGTTAYYTITVPYWSYWDINSCLDSLVDHSFTLFDANNVFVASNDDNRCYHPCTYGPPAIGTNWTDRDCLAPGIYTLEVYLFSWGGYGAGCIELYLPQDFSICVRFWPCTYMDTQDQIVAFELSDAFPNPFNPSTTISFTLAETAEASLKVFNVAGAEVANLVNGLTAVGEHSVVFDAANLTSGVYFYTLDVAGVVETRKMFLIK